MGTNGTAVLADVAEPFSEADLLMHSEPVDWRDYAVVTDHGMPEINLVKVECSTSGCDRVADFCDCGECDRADVQCHVCETAWQRAYEEGWRAGMEQAAPRSPSVPEALDVLIAEYEYRSLMDERENASGVAQ